MRILHCAESVTAGVGTVLAQLAEHQISSGDDVICVYPQDENATYALDPRARRVLFDRRGRDLRSLWNFARAIRTAAAREHVDIVHLHSSFAGLVGRLATFGLPGRPKVVYCPHCFSFLMDGGRIKSAVFALVERALQWRTDKIICVSEHEYQVALRRKLPAHKLEVVRNGIQPAEAGRSTRATTGPLKLLFVGRWDRQKGLDVLLRAFQEAQRQDLELVVVGGRVKSGPDAEPPALQGEAAARVKYVGWKQGDALLACYLDAHAIVVPSRWEGFAMVPLEGMRVGLPVIASDASSLPEVVVEGITGWLFPSGDSAQLARVLEALTIEDCIRMGSAAQRMFLENFTLKRTLLKTDSVYRQLSNARV
jgi:glycosyltransferase involved in cell wall biosynthesis